MEIDQDTQQGTTTDIDELRNSLSTERFRDWYQERQYRQNIENGTPYFNNQGYVPESERHSPSQLLQCHRKIFYRQCNAPAEQSSPEGIFWFGSQFEEEIAFPFLTHAVTGPDTYVQNTIWIDFTVETDVGEIRIKGATDPVIVNQDAIPILPTEIKTKSSVDHLTSPNRHHKAQLHSYMAGLSEKYDTDISQAILMYGARKSLNTQFFHVEFDRTFWDEVVLNWATTHTEYRLQSELPPPNPEYDWECEFCEYKSRCGKGDSTYANVGPEGLLPDIEYPREKVSEYIDAHPDSCLPATLAQQHPELREMCCICDWKCPCCSIFYEADEVNWSGDLSEPPLCPTCSTKNQYPVQLVQPSPSEQMTSAETEAVIEAATMGTDDSE